MVGCTVVIPVTLRGGRAALTLLPILALAPLVISGGAAAQQGATLSFDDQPAERPPPGFVFAGSPSDQVGQWVIVREDSNGVLAQVQQGPPGARLAVVESPSFADLILSTRIRFAGGAGSAGLVWRYRDADNYYLAALDLRAQAVRICWVPQDDAQAVAWYHKAADQGLAAAQVNLGVMYQEGEGVPQDDVEAHKWGSLAASRVTGDQQNGYAQTRDALAKQMTPEQLAEAQKRVADWQAAFEGRQPD